jgi:hypothetical protein
VSLESALRLQTSLQAATRVGDSGNRVRLDADNHFQRFSNISSLWALSRRLFSDGDKFGDFEIIIAN